MCMRQILRHWQYKIKGIFRAVELQSSKFKVIKQGIDCLYKCIKVYVMLSYTYARMIPCTPPMFNLSEIHSKK